MFNKKHDPSGPEKSYHIDVTDPAAGHIQTSLIGQGLHVTGSLVTDSDLHIDGTVEGEIRANVLTLGQGATVRGDIVAEDVVVSGTVHGSIRSDKVRLSNTSVVEGEIVHRIFAIEAGAHFDGTVQHTDDPLDRGGAPANPGWNEVASQEVTGSQDTGETPTDGGEEDPNWS